jgi:hypothetical protein
MMTTSEYLNRFLVIAAKDSRLSPMHMYLYVVLCVIASVGDTGDFSVSRSKVMQLCKVRSHATYHKYMRALQQYGYIDYFPSYHPVKASRVTINLEAILKKNVSDALLPDATEQ